MQRRMGVLDNMIVRAAQAPSMTAAAEMAGVQGATIAAYGAQSMFPGNSTIQFVAELLGGAATPGRAIAQAGPGTVKLAHRGYLKLFKGGTAEHDGAVLIQQAVTASGGDTELLAKNLLEINWASLNLPDGHAFTNLTPAQLLGDSPLNGVVRALGESRATTRQHAESTAKASWEALTLMATFFHSTGNADAIRMAAQMHARAAADLVQSSFARAQADILDMVNGIHPESTTGMDKVELGKRFAGALGVFLRSWRSAESKAWDNVDLDAPALKASNLGKLWDDLNRLMLPTTIARFPRTADVKAVLKAINGQDGPEKGIFDEVEAVWASTLGNSSKTPEKPVVTARILKELRSELLDVLRDNSTTPKVRRIANKLAGAVLDDLDVIYKKNGSNAYLIASAITREGHDTILRSFVGKNVNRDMTFAEDELHKMSLGSVEQIAYKLQQLDEMTEFMSRADYNKSEVGPAIREFKLVQEHFVKLIAKSLFPQREDAATGAEVAVIMVAKVENFIAAHAPLFRRFPEVETTLRELIKKKGGLEQLRKINNAQTLEDTTSVFAKVAGIENPSETLRRNLWGSTRVTPQDDLKTMIKVAKDSGVPDAEMGLARSVSKAAVEDARGRKTGVDFEILHQRMTQPLREGPEGESVMKIMVDSGLWDADFQKNFEKLVKIAANLQKAGASPDGSDVLDGLVNFNAFETLVYRVTGGRAALFVAGKMGPLGVQSLQIASAGAQFAQQQMMKNPVGAVADVLHRAAKDPAYMALLLTRPTSARHAGKLAMMINAHALWAGYGFFRDEAAENTGGGYFPLGEPD